MRTSDKLRDAIALTHYGLVLSKTETFPEIAQALDRIGYGPELLEEGRELLRTTREVYERNKVNKDEQRFVRTAFQKQKELVDSRFREHRNRALIAFRKDKVKASILAIDGKYPKGYEIWIETIRKFYTEAATDKEIRERLLRLKLTKEDAEEGLAGIREMERLYAERMKLKGVSKSYTKKKNAAFDKLYDWMCEFFAAAKVVMKNKPELLESLNAPA